MISKKLSCVFERGNGQSFWKIDECRSRHNVCVVDGIFPWVIPIRAKFIQFRVTIGESEQALEYNRYYGLVGSPQEYASRRWQLEATDFPYDLPKGKFVQCLWW